MKYADIAAQEAETLEQLDQLRESKARKYEHPSGLVVTVAATEGGVSVTVTCPEMMTGNLSSDPLTWLTTEQLRFVADCREHLERWVAGGDAPPEGVRP